MESVSTSGRINKEDHRIPILKNLLNFFKERQAVSYLYYHYDEHILFEYSKHAYFMIMRIQGNEFVWMKIEPSEEYDISSTDN